MGKTFVGDFWNLSSELGLGRVWAAEFLSRGNRVGTALLLEAIRLLRREEGKSGREQVREGRQETSTVQIHNEPEGPKPQAKQVP